MAALQKILRKQHVLVFYEKSKSKIPDLGKAMDESAFAIGKSLALVYT